jgi:transposase
MSKKITYVGLDVHKNSITMALFVEQRKDEEFIKKVANNPNSLLNMIKKLSEEFHLRVCYEASGCGYSIYRKFIKNNIDCIVVTPVLVHEDRFIEK